MDSMTRSRKWAAIVTLVVIFGTGLVAGLWLNRRAALTPVPPPPHYEALETGEAVVMRVYQEISP
jgi:hypothetical protein